MLPGLGQMQFGLKPTASTEKVDKFSVQPVKQQPQQVAQQPQEDKSWYSSLADRRKGDEQLAEKTKQAKKQTYVNQTLLDLKNDIGNNASEDEIKKYYDDIPQEVVGKLYYDIKNGAKISEVIQAYPELADIQETAQGSRFSQVNDEETNIFGIPKIPRFNNMESGDTAGGAKDVLMGFGENVLKSGANLVSDIGNVLLDPVDSAVNIGKLGVGAGVNAYEAVTGDTVDSEYGDMASQVGEYIKGRFGSAEGFQKAAYEDPVGLFSDIASVISGGAGLAGKATAKAGQLGKVSSLTKAGDVLGDIARTADRIDPGNILMGKGMQAYGKGYDVIKGYTKPLTGRLGKAIQGTLSNVQEKWNGFGDAQKKSRQSNPLTQEKVLPVLKRIDEEGLPSNINELATPEYSKLSDQVEQIIKERRSAIAEDGEVYNLLRKDKTPIDTNDMVSRMEKVLEGTDYNLKNFLKRVDPGNLLGTRKVLSKTADIATLHDIRKGIDDLMKKAEVNKDSGEFRTLSGMRKIVNSKLKENQNRAKNDEIFARERGELAELEQNLVYKDKARVGEMKDNIDNIIKNINNPAKKRIRDRLIAVMPDIVEQVDAINQIVPIAKAYTSIPTGLGGKITGAVLGGGIGATGGLPGMLLGGIVGLVGDTVIASARRKSILNAISKQSVGAVERMQELTKMIEDGKSLRKAQVDEIKKFADDLKSSIPKEEQKSVDKITSAIILKAEGALETSPIRTSTTKKTRTLGPGATQQTKKPGLSSAEGLIDGTLSTTKQNATPADNMSTTSSRNTDKKVKSDTVNTKASDVEAPKQSDTLVSKSDEMGKLPKSIEKGLSNIKPGDLGKGIQDNNNVKKLQDDILKTKEVSPIEIGEDGNIVDGEHRYKALMNLGVENIPVYKGKQLGISGRLEKPYQGIRIKVDIPSISKELQPLYQEAKKYKSADEFMEGNKVYHGTNQEFNDFDIELGGKATSSMPSAKGNIFFTKDKSEAIAYAKNANKSQIVDQKSFDKRTEETQNKIERLEKSGKRDEADSLTQSFEEEYYKKINTLQAGKQVGPEIAMERYIDPTKIKEINIGGQITAGDLMKKLDTAKKEGYLGAKLIGIIDAPAEFFPNNKGTTQFAVWDKKALLNKSQLRKIREEANK